MGALHTSPPIVALTARLNDAGFSSQRRAGFFTRALTSDDVTGWLSLHLANYGDTERLIIDPRVGVSVARIEQNEAEMMGERYQRNRVSTLGTDLPTLVGRTAAWRIDLGDESEVADTVEEVFEGITGAGAEWMDRRDTLEAVMAAFDRGEGDLWFGPYRHAHGLLLLGRDEEAKAYVRRMEAGEFELNAAHVQTWAEKFRIHAGWR